MSTQNGLYFESRRRFPIWSVIWAILAALLFLPALMEGDAEGFAWAALPPACWAIAGLLFRPAGVQGTVDADALRLIEPPLEIPYSRMTAVIDAGRNPKNPLKRRFAIQVHHDGPRPILTIPKRLDIPSEHVYQALLSRLPISSNRPVNMILAEYVARHSETFGSDRVFAFNGLASRKRAKPLGYLARVYALTTLAVAIAMLIQGASLGINNQQGGPYFGSGILLGFFSFLVLVVSYAQNPPIVGIKGWENASLAISPIGLALVQGDVKGELTWNQLLDVKHRPRGADFRLANNQTNLGIVLKVEGAVLAIVDIYDRPLSLIHERIVRYWRPTFDETIFAESP